MSGSAACTDAFGRAIASSPSADGTQVVYTSEDGIVVEMPANRTQDDALNVFNQMPPAGP